MEELRVIIERDGTLKGIYHDALHALLDHDSEVSIKRASAVEPDPADPRQWMVDLGAVGGPILKGFALRADALAAEVLWLRENYL